MPKIEFFNRYIEENQKKYIAIYNNKRRHLLCKILILNKLFVQYKFKKTSYKKKQKRL